MIRQNTLTLYGGVGFFLLDSFAQLGFVAPYAE